MKHILYLLFIVCDTFLFAYADDLIHLNDDNFEHLTQAATGATTGDWLVLMMSTSECTECSHIISVLKGVAEQLQGRLNVALIEPENSRLTLRRFNIGKNPVILFFRLGYQWQYTRFLAVNDIVSFVTEGYVREKSRSVHKQIDRFDVWYEDYVKEMKASYKERRLPEQNALLTTVAGVIVGLIVLACLLSSKKKTAVEDKKEASKKSKKQR